MKLFGWMHTKFRQDSSDGGLGDLAGSTCNCLSRCLTMDDCHQFRPLAPARISQPAINFPTMSEKEFMLESLLAIGTLGLSSSEPIMEESTGMAEPGESEAVNVEAIAEKEETEAATETDLMAINAELEKVLLAEAEKEGGRLSSARPSHAGKASAECPLQDYLFGAKVEPACTAGKKEKRASLGELFMIEEGEQGAMANGLINGGATKELRSRESTGVHVIMKRMLSRRKSTPRSLPTSCADGNATDKFNKVLQIFHKKVHPENNTASKKATKPISKQRNKGNPAMSYIGHCFIAGSSEKEPEIKTESTTRSKHVTSIKPSQEDPPSLSLSKSDSMGSREHWIKTDVDYLVLEL